MSETTLGLVEDTLESVEEHFETAGKGQDEYTRWEKQFGPGEEEFLPKILATEVNCQANDY